MAKPKTYTVPTRRIEVELPAEQVAAFDAAASSQGMTRSDLLRVLVGALLDVPLDGGNHPGYSFGVQNGPHPE